MRLWSVLVPLAAVLLAGAPPAAAQAAVPTVTVTSTSATPPSYSGQCYQGVQFTFTATITADGPGVVSYFLSGSSGGTLTFNEAGSKTVTSTRTRYHGWGQQAETIWVNAGNQTSTNILYDLACTEAVPQGTTLQPVTDYVGRCGADVVHTATAQITSPIAQTVRYRWNGYNDRELPGAEGVREIVFTEPGTKTVTTPFQRQPIPNSTWGDDFIGLEIVHPNGREMGLARLQYRTVCVNADFTAMTRLSGTCKPATPYKFKLDGWVESSAAERVRYAWARQTEAGGEWYRDPWTEIVFDYPDVPRRQAVSKTILVGNGESGAVRLEVLGNDGNVVTASRSYRTCNVDL
ncbi:hypothetical protein [Herbidospora cretacea]|uniref:hypothetical protein n=1 Tax=Herbidospora cretacea TaxID=28444 RepID=UPI0012DC2F2E|nr:hypothetical protein [Herbidospora cretacea]